MRLKQPACKELRQESNFSGLTGSERKKFRIGLTFIWSIRKRTESADSMSRFRRPESHKSCSCCCQRRIITDLADRCVLPTDCMNPPHRLTLPAKPHNTQEMTRWQLALRPPRKRNEHKARVQHADAVELWYGLFVVSAAIHVG